MRVSVISWLRFLIFQQFNVFKLVSKNRSFQVLLHQSNQGSLQRLSRRDGSGSCSETFTLIWNNHLQTLWLEQMGRLRLVQCMQNCGGKEAPSRAGRWDWGKLNLESVLLSCRAGGCSASQSSLEGFGMNRMSLFLLLSFWGGFGQWNCSGLKDPCSCSGCSHLFRWTLGFASNWHWW